MPVSVMWFDADGYVYAVHDTDKNLIKIGCTTNPTARFQSLQCECKRAGIRTPRRILAIANVSRCYAVEQVLHIHFREHKDHGEWFKLHPSDVINTFTSKQIDIILREQKEKVLERRRILENLAKGKKRYGQSLANQPRVTADWRRKDFALRKDEMKLARAFGLTVDELLKGVDVEKETTPALV